jgi:hypothetical protein
VASPLDSGAQGGLTGDTALKKCEVLGSPGGQACPECVQTSYRTTLVAANSARKFKTLTPVKQWICSHKQIFYKHASGVVHSFDVEVKGIAYSSTTIANGSAN